MHCLQWQVEERIRLLVEQSAEHVDAWRTIVDRVLKRSSQELFRCVIGDTDQKHLRDKWSRAHLSVSPRTSVDAIAARQYRDALGADAATISQGILLHFVRGCLEEHSRVWDFDDRLFTLKRRCEQLMNCKTWSTAVELAKQFESEAARLRAELWAEFC